MITLYRWLNHQTSTGGLNELVGLYNHNQTTIAGRSGKIALVLAGLRSGNPVDDAQVGLYNL